MNNTVLLVSHNMEDIARFSDKILVMNKSRVWMYDTPESVFRRSDELKELGLGVPQITGVFSELIKRGVPLPPSVFTAKQAATELIKLIKREKQ